MVRPLPLRPLISHPIQPLAGVDAGRKIAALSLDQAQFMQSPHDAALAAMQPVGTDSAAVRFDDPAEEVGLFRG